MTHRKYILSAMIAAVALLVLVGCGGSSSTSSNSTAPSREFISKGGENKYAEFGEVASDEEREAASRALAANLQARQAGEWEAQCSSLTRSALKELVHNPGSQPLVKVCASKLKFFAEPLKGSVQVRKDNLKGEIDVLRVEGERGFALFHGPKGKDYAMPMEKEDGEWKVGAVVTAELN